MKKILFIALVFLIGCKTNQSSEDESQEKKTEQYLLYISSRGNGFDIYQNNTSGTQEKLLTGQEGWEWAPLWIPAEKKIIYNRQDTTGTFSIEAMDGEGTPLELNTEGLEEYILSPDGQKVAFTKSDGDYSYINVLNLRDSKDTLNISNVEAYSGRPTWSPDGKKIVYISDRTGSNEIYVYDFVTSETQQITENNLREKYMSWSPDGSQIATTMQKSEEANDIFIITLSDLSVSQLTNTAIDESEIAWSLLGDKIAYHAQVNEKDDIYTIHVNTRLVTQITHGEGYHGEPTWMLLD